MDCFVKLGELSADAYAAFGAEDFAQVVEEFPDSMARFVEHDGVSKLSIRFEKAFPCCAFRREKTGVEETVAGEPRNGESGYRGPSARGRGDGEVPFAALSDQPKPGIRDGGGAGIGNQSDVFSGFEAIRELARLATP